MSKPQITVRHEETASVVQWMCSTDEVRVGMDVLIEITFEPGQHLEALDRLDRAASDIRRQIADAAERAA